MAEGRRVVVVGGGASGTLTAIQLLRRAAGDVTILIVEPRERLGTGVAFGTSDPWHRLNVPAITMSGVAEDPDHFRAFAGCSPDTFPPRHVFGAYLGALLSEARAASPARFDHVRAHATAVRDDPLRVDLSAGPALEADAVVVATGNALPRPPAFLRGALDDSRFIGDPWASGALDGIGAGTTVGIIGTGHTAIDLAASLIRRHSVARVVAVSRHGEIPRSHENPWRPRPGQPAFTVDEFRGFADPIAETRTRYAEYPLGWRQALDSMRPYHRELWLAMDDATRRRVAGELRREWEVHRSRLAPGVEQELRSWEASGRLELRAAGIEAVEAGPDALRLRTDGGTVPVHHLLQATGPDESPAATPLLASMIAAGIARPGPLDLGIDVHPYDYRVRD